MLLETYTTLTGDELTKCMPPFLNLGETFKTRIRIYFIAVRNGVGKRFRIEKAS